ncbi:hypothetical protein B566_EDAN018098 [Ephemera danica]|nr:hypothetical protein B566_EDAN018098 [Ephemera danica]
MDGALTVDVNETSLFFSCDESHRLVGQNNVTCHNGLLSLPKPVCEAVQDITRLLLYCVPVMLILICLSMAGIMFIMRRRSSNNILRKRPVPRSRDIELQPAVRPDTSHYEEMNVKCGSVLYDDVLCNVATLPHPDPEYVNSSDVNLSTIGNRHILNTK